MSRAAACLLLLLLLLNVFADTLLCVLRLVVQAAMICVASKL